MMAPLLECEVALHIARTISPHGSEADAVRSVGGIGAAFELVDPDLPLENLDEILARGLFHRAVALGRRRSPSELKLDDTARVSVRLDGREMASTTVDAITGRTVELLRSTSRYLSAFGETVEAGDVVITGALIGPLPLASGQHWEMEITGVGAAAFKTSDRPASPEPG